MCYCQGWKPSGRERGLSQCQGLRPRPSLERKQQHCLLDPSSGGGAESHPAGPGGALASDQSRTVACPSHTSSRVRAANVYSHSSLCATSAQAGATGLIPECSQLRALSGPCCFNQVYQVLLPLCASELFLFVCFCFLIEINIWLWPRVQTEHLICPQLEKKSFLQTSRGGTIT